MQPYLPKVGESERADLVEPDKERWNRCGSDHTLQGRRIRDAEKIPAQVCSKTERGRQVGPLIPTDSVDVIGDEDLVMNFAGVDVYQSYGERHCTVEC